MRRRKIEKLRDFSTKSIAPPNKAASS